MKAVVRLILLGLLWLFTLWIVYWAGFNKSAEIGAHTQRLNDESQLMDQKFLLSEIESGDVANAEKGLNERIIMGSSMSKLPTAEDGTLIDTIRQLIYPREAITLIRVYKENLQRRQNLDHANESRH